MSQPIRASVSFSEKGRTLSDARYWKLHLASFTKRRQQAHGAQLVVYADAIHLPATPFLHQEFTAIFLKASHISSRAIHKQQRPRVPEGSVWLVEIKFTIGADQILLIMDQSGKWE